MLPFVGGVVLGIAVFALTTRIWRNLFRGVAFEDAADLVKTIRLDRPSMAFSGRDAMEFAEAALRQWSTRPGGGRENMPVVRRAPAESKP